MRALPLALLLTLTVAVAQPAPTEEPEEAMVVVPEAFVRRLLQENSIMRSREERVIKTLENWQVGTNCT